MIGAALGVAGGLLGLALQKRKEKKQVKQTEKLQEVQVKGAKEMSDYEKSNQMDMWNKTNYGAQKEHMEKAGLNPALMYGMGGGQGATTGGGSGAMPSATAEAPSGQTKNVMDMALMAANIKVMNSQAEKNTAEAAEAKATTTKTAGVDTEGRQIENRSKEIDTRVKEAIGEKYIEREARIEMQANNAENAKKIREFDVWMSEAFDENGLTTNVDGYGSYQSAGKNDLIRKVQSAGLKEQIQKLKNLEADYQLKQDDHTLNEIEIEIRNFKETLAGLGLNEVTSSILKTVLGLVFGGRR